VDDLFISPSVGGVGLVEYVCTHSCLTNYFSEEDPDYIPEDVEQVAALHPTVPVYPGPPQRASMVWYSDEALEAFPIVVWSLAFVLFLVALALPCPLCRHDVKD
jgi:hypothetical protein